MAKPDAAWAPRLRDLLTILQIVVAASVVIGWISNLRTKSGEVDSLQIRVDSLRESFEKLQSEQAVLDERVKECLDRGKR
jgi:hypothetical protein